MLHGASHWPPNLSNMEFINRLSARRLRAPLCGATAALLALAGTSARAQTSKVNALINLEFSDHYITPRGLDVENQGVVFQPLVLILWDLYSDKDSEVNDISLTTGAWDSVHTHPSGAIPGHWNEIDPISGLTFKIEKAWQLDVFYTAFHSQVHSYPTSTNLDIKLTYHDIGSNGITLNPYVEFFDEVKNKATVDLNPATSHTSSYFAFGIDPTMPLKNGLKLELPTFTNLVQKDFYQRFDGTGGGSGFALVSTELKISGPLTFISGGYGHWSWYAGAQYYHLMNAGLLDGNEALNATAKRERNLFQGHAGVTIFF